jgi:glycosyltransferase involved in cell wall biosynthesis
VVTSICNQVYADMGSVTVIIPTLNEGKSNSGIINKLQSLGYSKILIIDGKSNDQTVEIAKDMGADVLIQDGIGKGDALRQALSYDDLGDLVIIMDADGSMDPAEIPAFLSPLENGQADITKGSRFLGTGFSEDMTLLRRFGNGVFVFLVNNFFSAKYTDLCYGYAAFKKDAIRKLLPSLKSDKFEIETEIFVKAKKMGLQIAEVPSVEYRRLHGKSNLNTFRDGFKILSLIFREAF